MPLEEYRRKRKFVETPEPKGRMLRGTREQPTFVVQKHDATSLHYDFRLEVDGVMVSWAVPKGPSLRPADKRLAMMTEDHPIEYSSFEGVIPEGQYGAGPVMVWDRGWYEIEGDTTAADQIERGEFKFILHGEKLRGGFVLVRTGSLGGKPSQKKKWLLIKHRDEHADDGWDIDASRYQRSVSSGRTLAEIAERRTPRRAFTSSRTS
jgi:bifunctional non-homologous end joining protein LigD